MKKLLIFTFLSFSFLFSGNVLFTPVDAQATIPCGIARPGVTCLNPDGTTRPGSDGSDPSTGNQGDPSTGNDDEPSTGNETGTYDSLKLKNILAVDNVQDLLAIILSTIVQIAIPFLVLAIMWVGFLFVAARGNPEKLSQAKQALFFTLLGALIILGAQTLSVILSGTIRELTNQ